MSLRPLPVLAQHPVYQQGDIAEEMYIVLKGELQVTFESGASRNDVPKMRIATRFSRRARKEGWVPMLEDGFEEAIVQIDRTNPKMVQQREQKHPPLTVIASEVEILHDYDKMRGSTGKSLYAGEIVDVLEIRQGEILGYLGEGAYFGESMLLAQNQETRRDRTVTAMENCDLAYLQIDDLHRLRNSFPELNRQLRKYAKIRQKLELPKQLFHVIDTDDSGSLTKDELYEMLVQLEVVVPNKRIFMICEPDAIPDGPWWSTSDQAELPSELMRTGLVFELPIDKDPKVWQPSLEAHAWLFGAMGLVREAGTPAGGRAAPRTDHTPPERAGPGGR
jgi:CRP-like cAMP-binding protein